MQDSATFYTYPVEQCDIPHTRRNSLMEYRKLRETCLRDLRGPSSNPIYQQINYLAWHTATFHTLQEARRIEPHQSFSQELWKLVVDGYATVMSVGIRRLVDTQADSISINKVIKKVKNAAQNNKLITRENFICHDGLPYDYRASLERYRQAHGGTIPIGFHPTEGPEAWSRSETLHHLFNRLSGHPSPEKRTDVIHSSVITKLEDELKHPAIGKICTFTNKQIAHVADLEILYVPTYEEAMTALKILCTVSNFITSTIFYDLSMGTVVPNTQKVPFEGLDQPWVASENIHLLRNRWEDLCNSMNSWTKDNTNQFLL
jgi:hypothetical protein